jgi:hypothetical protein
VKKGPSFSFDISREGIEARLDEMGRKLERMRGLYESFFMGVERTPPNTLRRDMNRQILEMQQVPIGNASLRFRYQALSQRWVLLVTYWNRTMREIESGTLSRDIARARRHMTQKGNTALTLEEALAMGIPASRAKAFVARQQMDIERRAKNATGAQPAAPNAVMLSVTTELPALTIPVPSRAPGSPPPIPPPMPAPSSLPGLGEADLQDSYRKYIDAHAKLATGKAPPSLEKMRERLAKQLPQILEANRCSRVRLEVAVDGDKVRLRAWPVSDKSSGA